MKRLLTLAALLSSMAWALPSLTALVKASGATLSDCLEIYDPKEWAKLVAAGAQDRVACGHYTGSQESIEQRINALYADNMVSPFDENRVEEGTSAVLSLEDKGVFFVIADDLKLVAAFVLPDM